MCCRSPTDAELLSKVGYVQLQLGDLLGAQQTFTKVDSLLADTLDNDLLNLAGRNRGLLHFAEKEYAKAFNEFTAVLGRNPQDIVSANNKVTHITSQILLHCEQRTMGPVCLLLPYVEPYKTNNPKVCKLMF